MKAKFICHPDFSKLTPINVFHKELSDVNLPDHPENLRNRHILFRQKAVFESFDKAVLKITADDYFKLYINENFITQGPPPSYPQRCYYMELDVGQALRAGENIFAVHTYYQGLVNRVWVSGDLRQSFWCELWIDGEIALVSDESWLCADHTGYSSCGIIGYNTAYAERYDSSANEVPFAKIDFDDSTWKRASVCQNADYNLVKSPVKELQLYDIQPQSIAKIPSGILIDFGAERVGYFCAEAQGNKNDKIIIHCGEELDQNGNVRFDMRCNCRYEEEWLLSGKQDTLEQFDYKAFRYVQLVYPETTQIMNIRMRVRHYPFEKKAVYETGNAKLNKVLKLCEDTVKYGTQEGFVDCPTREKGQYLGDLCVSGRAHCILTGDSTLLKKAINDFCLSSFICNGVMAVAPSSFMQEIADYSLLLPALVLWVYRFDNDKEFLKNTVPYLCGIYEYFKKYSNDQGLLQGVKEKWNLVDWPENLRDGYDFPLPKPVGDGVHNVLNALWIGFMHSMNEICMIVEIDPCCNIGKSKKAFIDAFYDTEKGLFCDSVQKTHSAVHSNIFPLLFDIGTEDEQQRKSLVDFICNKKLTSMGVYMAYFALAALVKHGESEKAKTLATDGGAWLNMINEGATVTFEAWGKEQKWNTSLFHPWASAPLVVFAKDILPY